MTRKKTGLPFERLFRLGTLLILGGLLARCAGLSDLEETVPLDVVPEMCRTPDGRQLAGFPQEDTEEILEALKKKK